MTDPLTGLFNRRHFSETFEKELNRAKRYGQPLGLVILDLHRFKEVNDKHGHPRGDDVLVAAAATLKKALRTSDSAFRIGGDEFALLLPQTDPAQAVGLSRRVEAVFAEAITHFRLTVNVGMDHGVATFPQDGDQAEQLIRVADERLYQLKHSNHRQGPGGGARVETGAAPSEQRPPEPSSEAKPRTIPFEPKATTEKTEARGDSGPVAHFEAPANRPLAEGQKRAYAVPRKAERVSMAGTNAYAVLGENSAWRARVLDLGFGGVALELEGEQKFPESVQAILHVPILPPVRVHLRAIWTQRTAQGVYRMGCAFVS